ncbi:hypothetical protein, partial [Mesorhizobium sp. M4A.F.Ca.ET.050.02.1.1]|uniref:hypothetical protein n=1 Tax=Mesorhizobium sp. M4A.F.Ca.ET.050.02.1.1 TaxID=2496754 RepID=UPI001AECCCB5
TCMELIFHLNSRGSEAFERSDGKLKGLCAATKQHLHRPDRCTIKKRQMFFIDKVLLGQRLSERSFRNLHQAI